MKIAGKGTPMLFIHGGPGSNSAYFEKEGGKVFEKDVQIRTFRYIQNEF